jgi:hypothetical protein
MVAMISDKLFWKVYAGIAGAVATLAAQKAASLVWRMVTDDDAPPISDDLDVSTGKALSWVLVSGFGVAASQLLVSRAIERQHLARKAAAN